MTRLLPYILTVLVALPGCLLWPPSSHSTVNEVTAANRYTANGSTTVFAYSFRILAKTDIEVSVGTTVKTVDTEYTVSGIGDSGGGNVTFLTAPIDTAIVTLLRKQPLAQASTYIPNEAFPSTRIEKDFDKLVMQVQQLKERIDRALTLAKTSSSAGPVVDAPTVGSFARGKVGGGVDWATVVSAGSISTPVAVNEGGTGATAAATALSNLGALPLAGGTLTGHLTSTKSCATGYTRITPNFCKAILPIVAAYTPNASCTGHVLDANLDTNNLVVIKVRWRTKANNAAAARTGSTDFSGSSAACAVVTSTTNFSTYEQAATAAGTVLAEGSDLILQSTAAGTLYSTDANAGGNGTSEIVSLESIGYYNNTGVN